VSKHVVGQLVLVLLAQGSSVTAQTAAEGAAAAAAGEPAAVGSAEDPALVEAGERFDRGVACYDRGDYGAALAEFLRAYELTGYWGMLYNLGQVSQALARKTDALTYFEDYLAGGGGEIAPERRTEVEAQLAQLRSQLAQLRVTVDADGAEIRVDDEVVGTAPLAEPLYLEPGPHVVVARHPDYGSVREEITLASEVTETVALTLIAPTGPGPGPGTPPIEEDDDSIASQWWFWTIIGAVVAGGAVTAGVLLAEPSTVWTDGTGGTFQLR
jgi:hypothetical protein